MTEAEWLCCPDWQPMLAHLAEPPNWRRARQLRWAERFDERKYLLYVCAGLRRIWRLLYYNASRSLVEVVERAADGTVHEKELDYAIWASECPTLGFDFDVNRVRQHIEKYGRSEEINRLIELGVHSETSLRGDGPSERDEAFVEQVRNAANIAHDCWSGCSDYGLRDDFLRYLSQQTDWPGGELVREVFGNPFRPLARAVPWRSDTVLAIARGIYADRTFGHLPILADALEEAGCVHTDLLAHCRSGGPHVLGCWALDWVMGK